MSWNGMFVYLGPKWNEQQNKKRYSLDIQKKSFFTLQTKSITRDGVQTAILYLKMLLSLKMFYDAVWLTFDNELNKYWLSHWFET